jgi:hypothetical protein
MRILFLIKLLLCLTVLLVGNISFGETCSIAGEGWIRVRGVISPTYPHNIQYLLDVNNSQFPATQSYVGNNLVYEANNKQVRVSIFINDSSCKVKHSPNPHGGNGAWMCPGELTLANSEFKSLVCYSE